MRRLTSTLSRIYHRLSRRSNRRLSSRNRNRVADLINNNNDMYNNNCRNNQTTNRTQRSSTASTRNVSSSWAFCAIGGSLAPILSFRWLCARWVRGWSKLVTGLGNFLIWLSMETVACSSLTECTTNFNRPEKLEADANLSNQQIIKANNIKMTLRCTWTTKRACLLAAYKIEVVAWLREATKVAWLLTHIMLKSVAALPPSPSRFMASPNCLPPLPTVRSSAPSMSSTGKTALDCSDQAGGLVQVQKVCVSTYELSLSGVLGWKRWLWLVGCIQSAAHLYGGWSWLLIIFQVIRFFRSRSAKLACDWLIGQKESVLLRQQFVHMRIKTKKKVPFTEWRIRDYKTKVYWTMKHYIRECNLKYQKCAKKIHSQITKTVKLICEIVN